ncbi:MAG: flagellar hook-length control protein FliK, partial [Paracoccaceae bacterium]|nr:flagellar hook-length control protein FliK [Paracoccaceae bacterium]
VVEGRLPVAPSAAQTSEVDVRKTVPDTAGKVEPAKAAITIAQPAPAQTGLAPVAMVEAQGATPVADKRAKAQPAEDVKIEGRQAKASTAFVPLLGVGHSTQPLTATAVASFMQGGQAEIVTKSLDAEVSIGLGGIERGLSSTQSVTGTPATATTETARHVAQQIAVSVMNTPGKATEIALNPEELGRVRLSLTAADGVITLAVLAERPETQDLLRRHMDVLAQEFRALGYGTISFSFGHDGQSGDRADQDFHREEKIAEPHEANTPVFRPHPGPVSGLDLRI